jgi:hypothetical protein
MSDTDKELNSLVRKIFGGGRIRQIKWGGDKHEKPANVGADGKVIGDPVGFTDAEASVGEIGFHDWPMEKQLEYAKDVASAMNQAADVLQTENLELQEKLRIAEAQRDNADDGRGIFKDTMTQAILNHNLERQKDAREIALLGARIKDLEKENSALKGQINTGV